MDRHWPRFSVRWLLFFTALVCVLAGFRTHTVQRHNAAIKKLRELGAQFDESSTTMAKWFTGIPAIERVTFLGLNVGDESVDPIVQASKVVGAEGITFIETRVTRHGQQNLKTRLPNVEISLMSPVLVPSDFDMRR